MYALIAVILVINMAILVIGNGYSAVLTPLCITSLPVGHLLILRIF